MTRAALFAATHLLAAAAGAFLIWNAPAVRLPFGIELFAGGAGPRIEALEMDLRDRTAERDRARNDAREWQASFREGETLRISEGLVCRAALETEQQDHEAELARLEARARDIWTLVNEGAPVSGADTPDDEDTDGGASRLIPPQRLRDVTGARGPG